MNTYRILHPVCHNNFRLCWPDPGDDHEEARGEVVSDYVERHLPGEHQLEPSNAIVHSDGHVVRVAGVELTERDLVVEYRLDTRVVRHEL